jgi:hypothetical protein
MKLFLKFRSVVAAFSATLVAEFDQLIARLNVWGAKEHGPDGTHTAISVTGFTFAGDTQTTVGAAGGATALPATPSGYLEITIGTTDYVIPYYAKS